MKSRTFNLSRTLLAAGVVALAGLAAVASPSPQANDKPKQAAPKLSDAERKAVKKFTDAKDFNARFLAAKEFVQKFPNSAVRREVALDVAGGIEGVTDPAQRITYAEEFLNTFANADETAALYPSLVVAYLDANRAEDAFNAAQTFLETSPNEAYVLYRLALGGINEAQRGNSKFAQQGSDYGRKAIQLIESNQRPAGVGEARWNSDRNSWLLQLYHSAALFALANNRPAEALPVLQKAAALNPNDPLSYRLLGDVRDAEYQTLVAQYKVAGAGAAQDAARRQAEAKLDEVIDLYARALAQAEGKPQFKPLYDQTRQSLETYYKYRHNNSTAGMQELVNKYKSAPATQP